MEILLLLLAAGGIYLLVRSSESDTVKSNIVKDTAVKDTSRLGTGTGTITDAGTRLGSGAGTLATGSGKSTSYPSGTILPSRPVKMPPSGTSPFFTLNPSVFVEAPTYDLSITDRMRQNWPGLTDFGASPATPVALASRALAIARATRSFTWHEEDGSWFPVVQPVMDKPLPTTDELYAFIADVTAYQAGQTGSVYSIAADAMKEASFIADEINMGRVNDTPYGMA